MTNQTRRPKDRNLEAIRLGVLIPGSTPIDVSGRIWHFGLAMTEEGQQAVFGCACGWRELFVQALVSSIGRALGLPIPQCFILLASKESFPDANLNGSILIFACKSGPHPTMAAFARKMSEAVDILKLTKRETTNRLIVLDEWALNSKRDDTVVLVDTVAGIQLVDHHPSLQQVIDPASQLRNWLFDFANAQINEMDLLRLRKEMESSAGKVFDIDLSILNDQVGGFGDAQQVSIWRGMLDFLAERRHHLEDLFCQRLGIPDERLKFQP